MKATRADVAKLAGVSTVSYVLNASRNMSEKTKKRVFDAVKQLNYKPDMIARSMTKNETMQLALIVNDITNPFYGEIMMGFDDIMFSSVWRPSISTVAASKTNFGQKAFENIIRIPQSVMAAGFSKRGG